MITKNAVLWLLIFLFKIALLRCNLHTIQFTQIIQCFLAYSQDYATIATNEILKSFCTPPKNRNPLLMRILYFLSSILLALSSVQFSRSVMSDSFRSMDCSTPGFPVHHQLLELVQTHVHQFGDAIEPSHPLFSPSPPAFNLAQHQSLFQ